jgi:hypothetical protein
MEWAGLLLLVSLSGAPSPEEEAALLEACTRAFIGGTCALAASGTEAKAGQVLSAEVELRSGAAVELTVRWAPDPPEQVRRELRFDGSDTDLERAKAVGLTVGVLGSELLRRHGAGAPNQPEANQEVTPENPGPPAGDEAAPPADSASLATLQLGVGWDEGLRAPESALAVRFGWRFRPSFWAGVAGGAAWSDANVAGLSVQKVAAVAWAGWGRSFGEIEALCGVDLGLESLAASSEEPLPPDRGSRWVPLVGASVSGAYWLSENLGVLVTGNAGWALSRTRLWVADAVLAEAGHLRFSLLVGPVLRWDPLF